MSDEARRARGRRARARRGLYYRGEAAPARHFALPYVFTRLLVVVLVVLVAVAVVVGCFCRGGGCGGGGAAAVPTKGSEQLSAAWGSMPPRSLQGALLLAVAGVGLLYVLTSGGASTTAAAGEGEAPAAARRLTEDVPVSACETAAQFAEKVVPVNNNCCSGGGADCAAGVPSTCNARCATVLPSFFTQCHAYLEQVDLLDVVQAAAALCENVDVPMSQIKADSVTDQRAGCPAQASPGSTLIDKSFKLKETSVVLISAQMIRNTAGRADLHLMLDDHRVDGAMTWTSAGAWDNAEAFWIGIVDRGIHTAWLESDEENMW